uniref:NADH dehydrogenase subunit 6 n=1 Tax=Pachycephus cruentatus TaxID=1090886 RepID=A0A1W6Q5C0_9HYME|nr:NADH dehydrogenase subunit 6 [Pachycephus cruentatus]
MLMDNTFLSYIFIYVHLMSKVMIMTLPLILMLTILSMKFIHPIGMLMYLIMFTILICLKMSFLYKSLWFSYLLFLSMIGGLLILFLYFVSTSSNEKIKLFKSDYLLISIIFSSMLSTMFIIYSQFDLFSMTLFKMPSSNMMNLSNYNWSNLIHFDSYQMFSLNYKTTILTMIYLLFTLFSLMKMCMKMYGPLRQFI